MASEKSQHERKKDSPEEMAKLAYDALKKKARRIIGPVGKKNVAKAAIMPDNVVAAKLRKSMEPSEKSRDKTRQRPAHKRSRHVKEKALKKR
jgi:hypothetical protein